MRYPILRFLIITNLIWFNIVSAVQESYSYSQFPDNRFVGYSAKMQSNGMYCHMRINGIPIMGNENTKQGILDVSHSFIEYMKNGANEVGIEFDSWNWFDPNKLKLKDEEKAEYNDPKAFCSLEVVKEYWAEDEENPEDQQNQRSRFEESIVFIKIRLNKDNKIIVDDNSYSQNEENDISIRPITKSAIRLEVPAKNIKNARTVFTAEGLPIWLWTESLLFENIPDNVELLEQAYQEVWEALDQKDEEKFKKLISIYIDETLISHYGVNSIDEVDRQGFYEQLGYHELFKKDFIMFPLNFENLKVKTFANGRLVQLSSDKDYLLFKYNENGKIKGLNHFYFSFINGNFSIVR